MEEKIENQENRKKTTSSKKKGKLFTALGSLVVAGIAALIFKK